VLVATAQLNKNVYLSARNIEGVTVSHNADLNALSLLTPRCVLITKSALEELVARAKSEAKAPAAE
jgi:large subunit ribosomal protein L4